LPLRHCDAVIGFQQSVDASLNLPHQVHVASDIKAVDIQGVVPPTGLIAPLTYAPQFQPNANVGFAGEHVRRLVRDRRARQTIAGSARASSRERPGSSGRATRS
jgi:hypothetical protein